MSHDKKCEACGQKLKKLNPHTMDSQKIRVLEDIAKLNLRGFEWVAVKEGEAIEAGEVKIRTAYRARAHASRLVWFGLLDHKGHRSGEYKVNRNGLEFLMGRLSVPKTIYCRDGQVIEKSPEVVFAQAVKKVVLDKPYWDNYDKIQKPAEREGQQLLLL